MKVLALDSSAIVATVAIVEDDKLIAEFTVNHKKTHSQTLMPMIDEICKITEEDLDTIDLIAVASGPGSFTGLRIGAATAKGLAYGLNKPIIGVPTLDGLAYNIVYNDCIICPIMDARRSQVYTAFYKWEANNLQKLTEYMAISIEECIEKVKLYNKTVVFLGDGVPVHKEYIQTIFEKEQLLFAPASCNMQRASSIASLALLRAKEGEIQSHLAFVPFYLRKSQAEREYEEKQRKKTL